MNPETRKAGGLNVRYAQAGGGGAETVVLTSPWPESLLACHRMWDRLAERVHLIAIDLPGFGKSEARQDPFSPPAMGSFLIELVTEWKLGPVHFVAPDVGTTAALYAAIAQPELVRSLAHLSGRASQARRAAQLDPNACSNRARSRRRACTHAQPAVPARPPATQPNGPVAGSAFRMGGSDLYGDILVSWLGGG
jgi:pimeloyl-ACP methyl ester carboxylesterase